MRPSRWLFLAVGALLSPALARADVKAPAQFSDNMVLQRGMQVPVWGTADPGEEVYVTFEQKTADGKREEGKSAIADKEGKWLVKLGPYPAGGEAGTLSIKGRERKPVPKGQKAPPPNEVVCKNVLIGEVWICSGQSNMQWALQQAADGDKSVAEANYPQIRLFQVPRIAAATPQADIAVPPQSKEGLIAAKWAECTPASAKSFSAVAYFFGRNLHQDLKVPIGLIDTSYGGTPAEAWTSRGALLANPELKYYVENLDSAAKSYDPEKAQKAYQAQLAKWEEAAEKAKVEKKKVPNKPQPPRHPTLYPSAPSGLFNAMIAPLIPYAIKGAIWYQGESNNGRAFEYRTLFPTMIEDWRQQWKEGDFPFLFVQLAPFGNNKSDGVTYAELRDAQLFTTTKLKNLAMAVITDFGHETDIHPKQKEPVGVRLALAARALAYGEKVEYSGPVYRSKKVEGNKIVLSFDHAGGLMAKGDKLTGFTIAGDNGEFVDADAVIEGDTVIVSSPKVDKPANVRFGWKNFMTVNLFNKEGLPASPFRTDDAPYTTIPMKK
jgi:sialate O-acetylesterase